MANYRRMGPKRPTKVIFVIAAIVFLMAIATFIGMNVSHNVQQEDAQESPQPAEVQEDALQVR